MPPTTELEQALRNGVILCRLGHYYAPTVIPIRRIYDFDEAKYKVEYEYNYIHVCIECLLRPGLFGFSKNNALSDLYTNLNTKCIVELKLLA